MLNNLEEGEIDMDDQITVLTAQMKESADKNRLIEEENPKLKYLLTHMGQQQTLTPLS